MEVRYQCHLSDYTEALGTPEAKPLGRKMLASVLAGVFVLFAIFFLTTLGLNQAAALVIVFVLWIAVVLAFRLMRPVLIRRWFRKHPDLVKPQVLRVEEGGVIDQNDLGQGETKWSGFRRFRETPNLFVLYLKPRQFQVIPKRAFSGAQLEEFRLILTQNIHGK
jgi:ABC-type transport system involved in multi-copper enzyme maturation permease subunit